MGALLTNKDKARPGRGLMRFIRSRDGSVAIEFGALAIPFAALVFAILESCISFAGQQLLANTTDDIARKLRTGQLRAADVNEGGLRTLICDQMKIIVSSDCPGLVFDLRKVDSFDEASKLGISLNAAKDDIDASGFGVTPGPAMSKNVLRVYYKWPVMTDLIRKSVSNLKDNKTLLFSMSTWQNEPF